MLAVSFAAWLDPAAQAPTELLALLLPFLGDDLLAVPVGRWVNDPRNEGPQCLEPAG